MFFNWNDRQCLTQAINIAKDKGVDLADIERWAAKEGELDDFMEFMQLIEKVR